MAETKAEQDHSAAPVLREQRMKALSDYISKVAKVLKRMATPDKPVRIDSRTGSLEFTPAEFDSVRRALGERDAAAIDLSAMLLAETLALRLKLSEDTKDYETAAGLDDELEEVIAGCLRRDLALAESLVADYRLVIDQLFVSDDREAANRLGEFRLAVRRDMSKIRQLLIHEAEPSEDDASMVPIVGQGAAPAELLDLEGLLPGAGDRESDEDQAVDPVTAAERRLRDLRERKAAEERKRRQRKRLRYLFGVLGLVILVAVGQLILNVVPAFQAPEIYILTTKDFADIPVVAGVEANPPSVLVIVKGHQWRKLNDTERKQVVIKVGHIVDVAAYNGVQLRDENGRLVGEWIRSVGLFVAPL